LIGRLDALLEDAGESASLESTLTDGCARALTLEAERLRTLRRVARIDSELEQLRARLAELRLRFRPDLP